MIKNEQPPNFEILNAIFPVNETSLYAYAPDIYSPFSKDIQEDRKIHEMVHVERQKDPRQWWEEYIRNPQFRLEEEIVAYATQYLAVKKVYPAKQSKEALNEFAHSLSGMYNLNITYDQAHTKIRKRAESLNRKVKQNKSIY